MLTIYFGFLLSLCNLSTSSDGPIVLTPMGKVLGWETISRSGRTYQAFTNVPYGKPPAGKLRLKAPQPAQKWQGVYNATTDGAHCMHLPFMTWQAPKFERKEDCLHLSIYRPKEPRKKSMPVLFFLLGGANMITVGEGRNNARYLMDEDLVLVEISFRVSSFGLLSLGDDVIPGNYMYKDQALALKWVKDNIASFGGNPNRVIVFGVSSGADATHALINSPLTRDMIHGAAAFSGTIEPFESFPANNRVKDISRGIIEHVNCTRLTSQEILDCLQELDAEKLAVGTLMGKYDPIHIAMGLVIEPKNVEGAFMTESPFSNMSRIPFITTVCNGELVEAEEGLKYDPQYTFRAYQDLDQHLTDWMNIYFDDQAAIAEKVEKVKKRYFPVPQPLSNFSFTLAMMYTDVQFLYGCLHNVRHHNGPMWMGYVEYKSDYSPLATYDYNLSAHAMIGDFIFDRTSSFPWSIPESARDTAVSKRVIRYFSDFANYLDPAPSGSPYYWPQYTGNRILRLQETQDIVGDSEFQDKMMDFYYFWEDVLGWW